MPVRQLDAAHNQSECRELRSEIWFLANQWHAGTKFIAGTLYSPSESRHFHRHLTLPELELQTGDGAAVQLEHRAPTSGGHRSNRRVCRYSQHAHSVLWTKPECELARRLYRRSELRGWTGALHPWLRSRWKLRSRSLRLESVCRYRQHFRRRPRPVRRSPDSSRNEERPPRTLCVA